MFEEKEGSVPLNLKNENNKENEHDLSSQKIQKEVSELNRLKNENRLLLKKVDELEGKLSNSGINPTELENRVTNLDTELKNILRESSDMARMLSNLYRERKKPNTKEEYDYVSSIYNRKIKEISTDYAKVKGLLMQSDETIEKLKNEINEVKIKSNENNLEIQEKAKEEKKLLEDRIKSMEEDFSDKFKQIEDKLNKKSQDLLEKTEEVLTLSGKTNKLIEENTKLTEKKGFLEKQNESLLDDIKDLKEYVKEFEGKDGNSDKQGKDGEKDESDSLRFSEEYREMSDLISSLMKERKAPSNNKEFETLLNGYKEQIKVLKMVRPEEDGGDLKEELEKVIKEKELRNNELEKDILKLKGEIEDYKKGIAELLQKLKEEEKKREFDKQSELSAIELEEELNSIGEVLTSFIKERKQPMNTDEANSVVENYKKEIAELKRIKKNSDVEEECVRLKKRISELEDNIDRTSNYDEEIGVLKDIVNSLKAEVKEKSLTIEKLSSSENVKNTDTLDNEYEEMNNLLSSFLKERKMPISDEETARLINKYKEEIRELKKGGIDSDQYKKLEKLIEEKDKELDELKKVANEYDSNIARLKNQLTELNLKMRDMEKKGAMQGSDIVSDKELQEEYEEMSLFVASLIRERKRPFTDDETEELLNRLKREIHSLKEAMKNPKEEEELRIYKKRVEELEKNLKTEKVKPSEEVISGADKSQGDLVLTLKREITELKAKLASANNKLSLYGDQIIK